MQSDKLQQHHCSLSSGMFSNRMLLAELHSAVYRHHAAEIRTVSAGSYVAFPEAEFLLPRVIIIENTVRPY